jgi:hypothetical protein
VAADGAATQDRPAPGRHGAARERNRDALAVLVSVPVGAATLARLIDGFGSASAILDVARQANAIGRLPAAAPVTAAEGQPRGGGGRRRGGARGRRRSTRSARASWPTLTTRIPGASGDRIAPARAVRARNVAA